MKKLLITPLLSVMLYAVSAQIVLNPQLAPVGLVVKSQLWNLSIINTGNQDINVQVQLLMTDASNSQKIFSGTSRFISLRKGLTQVTANDAAPVNYSVLAPGYGIDGSPDGFLPVGVFSICYSVNMLNKDLTETLAQECENVEVQPISPPSLISPSDSDKLDINRPMFTWIPPSPSNLFSELSYGFKLVELQPTQNGPDAIQQNIPLAEQSGISTTSLQYPPSLPELDTNKLYAWQITANNGFTTVSKSEVWVFKINSNSLDTITGSSKTYYVKASRTADASFAVCNGVLRYAYMNQANDPYVNFNLYDISGSSKKQLQLDSSYFAVKHGQNYNEVDFTQNTTLVNKHMYLLELISPANERWYVKFEFIKP